jgi:hypothetical protein
MNIIEVKGGGHDLAEYLQVIAVASLAGQLHALRKLAGKDITLTQEEIFTVNEAIDRRFGALNAAAIGEQKPRWT